MQRIHLAIRTAGMVIAVGVPARQAAAASFTVDSIRDLGDANPGDGVCDTGQDEDPECTLRAALEEVMALGPPGGARHEINFNIEPEGRHVIVLSTPLPEITQPVYLRGKSQPRPSDDDRNKPAIELRGAFPDSFVTPLGLKITVGGSNSVVENLAITNIRNSFAGFQAILLEETSDVTVVENYLGVSVVDAEVLGNGIGIEIVNSSRNLIGTQDPLFGPAECGICGNIIGRNNAAGIVIRGANSFFNVVKNNSIGTDESVNDTGRSFVGVGMGNIVGIEIKEGAFNNEIGGPNRGPAPFDGNLISGNLSHGVAITGAGRADDEEGCTLTPCETLVQGNVIGMVGDGSAALPNGGFGVLVTDSPNTHVGGPGVFDSGLEFLGNLISGNGLTGVVIGGAESTGALVQGNRIGTNGGFGDTAIPNSNGILVSGAPGVLVGGTEADTANVVSGNTGFGINLDGTGALVQGNFIGTSLAVCSELGDCSSVEAVPNGEGLVVAGENNLIGGPDPAARNLISGNNQDGVRITGGAVGNVLEGNFIGFDPSGHPGGSQLGPGARPNGRDGVRVEPVGGTVGVNFIGQAGGAPNVIAGNQGVGVNIRAAARQEVQNNLIGMVLHQGQPVAIPNEGGGVAIENAVENLIGGDSGEKANTISGNGLPLQPRAGVRVTGPLSRRNRVEGNFIGTDPTGALALPNTGAGVFIDGAFENVIGSAFVTPSGAVESQNSGGQRQVIAGNDGDGVHIRSDPGAGGAGDNRVEGNLIGIRASGSALPNGGAGVHVDATSGLPAAQNVIGGTAPGAGNLIGGNVGDGVRLTGAEARDNRVEGNLIGVNPAATDATSNGGAGVRIDGGRNNVVGGTAAGAGNVISGNNNEGVFILGTSATGNVVQGNFIGTRDGSLAIPNLGDGVRIQSGRDNLVGGTVAGASNTISGNEGSGVHIRLSDAINNRLEGNFIGTNADGTAIVPNTLAGVKIEGAPANIVGGTLTGAPNVIAGNGGDGVHILLSGATSNRIESNRIGTNPAGDAALPNSGAGVHIDGAPANTIGGHSAFARNLISGNVGAGVAIAGAGASGNLLQGNRIGTNLTGDAALPNSGDGVRIDGAPTTTVGGTAVERGNLISGNGGAGVRILNAGATGTILQSNFIGTNAAGNARLPNASHGIAMVDAIGSAIGANPGRNVISGNGAPGGSAAHGVFISGGSGHVVNTNRIGTNSAAGVALPNTGDGVHIGDSANNTIGGDVLAGEFNVISGNGPTPGNGVDGAGVRITGAQATGNRVQGNRIGVNSSGFSPLGNRHSGVIVSGAVNTTIGGQAGNSTANLIAANGGNGVEITGGATGTQVAGNRIGTNFFDAANVGNAGDGVLISGAAGNTIGGRLIVNGTAQERNIISGNGMHGIHIQGNAAKMNMVDANFIGTNSLGDTALPNGLNGVHISNAPNNMVGGDLTGGVGNLISGNLQSGVLITGGDAKANWLRANIIGPDFGRTAPLPNGGDGVRIDSGANDNLVGGTGPGDPNVIAFNGQTGVAVTGQSVDNGIRRNVIFDNQALGIDLGDDGVTPNDGLDDDTGPNNLQNFPALFVVFNDPGPPATTFVLGELRSTPDTTFALDFFSNPTCDPSGHGEGRTFVGGTLVTTDVSGNASFSTLLPSLGPDQFITATATLPFGVIIGVGFTPEGDTSEFSRCAEVLPPPCPSALAAGKVITKVWDDEAADELWETPLNWTGDSLPGPSDNVCIGPGFNVILSSMQSISSLFNSGTLSGTGVIEAELFSNAGTVEPGASAGILTITGDYTQTDTGTLVIEIGGLLAGDEHDQLAVSGTVNPDGTLDVSLIDDLTLGAAQQFLIIEVGDALSGQFAGLDEFAVVGNFGGTNLFITYAGGDGNDVVLFTSVPPDLDGDGDVDEDDLALFEACDTGPAVPYDPQNLPPGCTLLPDAEGIIAADFDGDGDVDTVDFAVHQRCRSGAGNPPDARCLSSN